MTVTNLTAPPMAEPANVVVATLHLRQKPIIIGGKPVWRIDLRDAAGGAAALQSARDAGGGDTDQATAAFLQMSGLSISQTLALEECELMRCLMIALTIAQVVITIENGG